MKRLLSLVILTGGLAPGVGASAHVLDVSPGALGSFLRSEKIESGSLVLRGTIDARDISALGTATLDTLDLSGITIASYVAARPLFFGARSFAANALPMGAFAGSQIRTVILPVALRSIPDNAFTASSVSKYSSPPLLGSVTFWVLRNPFQVSRVCKVMPPLRVTLAPKSATISRPSRPQ